jgi:RNA polymerase sigma-70 factor (ECF subfamily)
MTVDSSDGSPLLEHKLSSRLAPVRTRDTWAWERVYRELAPFVLRYLRASGAREPEDLLGEVFVRVVRKLPEFSGGAREIRAWVLTIAHSRLVDEWRHASRRLHELLPNEALALIGGAGDVEEEALLRLSDDRVRTIVGRLSPAQRDVLFLRLFADLTVAEVARVVGRRPGAVKALQVRALGAIRRELAREAVSILAPATVLQTR